MNLTAIIVTIVASLLSGIVAVIVSTYYYRRYDKAKLKRDVLRRFVGNRHFLTVVPPGSKGEPFIALNEAFIVFADSPDVIMSLKKMHKELGQPERLLDNIVALVKAMADSAGISLQDFDETLITKPFTPGRKTY